MNVLVVCTGNTCRSPMAAGLLKRLAQSKGLAIEARSAGLAPHIGQRVAENAAKAMAELGIDISGELSKKVTPDLVRWADLVVTVQQEHADYFAEDFPEATSKLRCLQPDVPDPYCGPLAEYRQVRDILKDLLLRFIESLGGTMISSRAPE
ncbi:MAG: hypothetical protein DMG27_15630 [Acidobacteria bacterium]|nr:MAG: hypothetical protein DMG27_15630 [Acidobacteriota bacterium]